MPFCCIASYLARSGCTTVVDRLVNSPSSDSMTGDFSEKESLDGSGDAFRSKEN